MRPHPDWKEKHVETGKREVMRERAGGDKTNDTSGEKDKQRCRGDDDAQGQLEEGSVRDLDADAIGVEDPLPKFIPSGAAAASPGADVVPPDRFGVCVSYTWPL